MVGARLKGQQVLVTGGSRGIGAGIARVLATEGARVALTYTSKPDLAEAVLKDLPGEGHLSVAMNVADGTSVNAAFESVIGAFGGLSGLVCNAGITRDQLLLRMKDEDFDDVIRINLRGAYLCAKAAVKVMLKARKGSIVNISSVVGHSGNPGQTNYSASKAGLEGLTRSLALEVASRSIRVNAIAPGYIATDMSDALTEEQKSQILNRVPLARMGLPEDVAQAVVYLLSDESSYVTGQTLHVNGGLYM